MRYIHNPYTDGMDAKPQYYLSKPMDFQVKLCCVIPAWVALMTLSAFCDTSWQWKSPPVPHHLTPLPLVVEQEDKWNIILTYWVFMFLVDYHKHNTTYTLGICTFSVNYFSHTNTTKKLPNTQLLSHFKILMTTVWGSQKSYKTLNLKKTQKENFKLQT